MNDFKFTQDYFVYKNKKEGVFPIKESDWKRLKRIIGQIIPHERIFQIFSSVFFGIFASSIFSLIAFQATTKIENWVKPVTWSICLVSLILAVSLLILDKRHKGIITLSTKDVLTDMSEIEKSFERDE